MGKWRSFCSVREVLIWPLCVHRHTPYIFLHIHIAQTHTSVLKEKNCLEIQYFILFMENVCACVCVCVCVCVPSCLHLLVLLFTQHRLRQPPPSPQGDFCYLVFVPGCIEGRVFTLDNSPCSGLEMCLGHLAVLTLSV